MIKRIALLLAAASLSFSVSAKEYDEGINYQTINAKPVNAIKPGEHEVAEFFWYACPHCFHFEPTLKKYLKNKPDNVRFVRIPAPLNPNWEMHTRAYYAAQQLGVADQAHEAIFKELHEKRNRALMSLKGIAAFYARYDGVSEESFMDSYNSFLVDSQFRKAKELLKRYDIHGVPVVIIDGKYKTDGSMAGSHQDIIEIIRSLTE